MRTIREVEFAVMRAGHVPTEWTSARLPEDVAAIADTPVPAEARAVETWLRFALPAGTHTFRLEVHHMPTHVWIDDIEVTVSWDAGTISLVHEVPAAATLTLQCLRAREHVGLAALRSPLHVALV